MLDMSSLSGMEGVSLSATKRGEEALKHKDELLELNHRIEAETLHCIKLKLTYSNIQE